MRLVRTVILLVVVLLPAMTARAADPFQSGRPSPSSAAVSLPAWMAAPIAAAARIQRDLNEAISSRIREVNESHSKRDLAFLLLLSFVYGAFHSARPAPRKLGLAPISM